MGMKSVLGMAVVGAALLSGTASEASAYDVSFPAAAMCMRWSGTDSQSTWPTFTGAVENQGTGVATLQCGVNQDVSADVYDDVRVYYEDASGGEFGEAVFCRGYSATADVASYYSTSWVYGCSTNTAGGCSSSTNGTIWTGTGYVTLPSLLHGPGRIVSAHCKLPRAQSGNYSLIQSLYIDT